MKNTLLKSVALSALLVGSTVAVPATGFVATAMAQDTTTKTDKPAADGSKATDDTTKSDDSMQSGDSSGSGDTMKSDDSAGSNDTMKSDDSSGSSDAMKSGDSTGSDDSMKTDDSAGSGDSMNSDDASGSGDTMKSDDSAASSADTSDDGQKIVTEQKDSEVLASTYIGQDVYNSNDKSIGEISDLVFDKDGGIKAAVVGVGGFLGIGEKSVAVKFDRISIERKSDSADVKLVTDMTSKQLKNAPAFKNLQAKMDEQNSQKAPAGGGTAGTGATGMGTTGGATGTGNAGSGTSAQ